ncbi:hypothetical protein DPMN_192782 [Dreissena polymorpha]|uniref:Uncharacterized protein n=1 Tax=Dreissena polymorpha TaxID=45954 RepID=A0A9D4BDA0_DREPO|nr:hypothetical protein DPMN_192782 [Dreissena polymorpha]
MERAVFSKISPTYFMKKLEYMGWRSARRGVRAWCPRTTHNHERREDGRSDTLEGGRRRGRQKKIWLDDVNELKSCPFDELLLAAVSCRDSLSSFLIATRSKRPARSIE